MSASPAIAAAVRGPELRVATAFGSRYHVVGGERVDWVAPASLLAAEVTRGQDGPATKNRAGRARLIAS
jgi:hypothetical protein